MAVAGRKSHIRFSGEFVVADGAGGERPDLLLAVMLGEESPTLPTSPNVDYAVLPRLTKSITQWSDMEPEVWRGSSGIIRGNAFTVDLLVDETTETATAQATINSGTDAEITAPAFEFDFEGGKAGARGGEDGASAEFWVDESTSA